MVRVGRVSASPCWARRNSRVKPSILYAANNWDEEATSGGARRGRSCGANVLVAEGEGVAAVGAPPQQLPGQAWEEKRNRLDVEADRVEPANLTSSAKRPALAAPQADDEITMRDIMRTMNVRFEQVLDGHEQQVKMHESIRADLSAFKADTVRTMLNVVARVDRLEQGGLGEAGGGADRRAFGCAAATLFIVVGIGYFGIRLSCRAMDERPWIPTTGHPGRSLGHWSPLAGTCWTPSVSYMRYVQTIQID